MGNASRPTGAIARVLSANALLEAGRKHYVEEYPNANPANLGHGPTPHMLIAVDRGVGAVINREGVGDRFNHETETVDVYFSNGYSVFPLALTLDEIGYAATDELIDLAEGIRSFGARLDSNHHTWYSAYDHEHTPQAA